MTVKPVPRGLQAVRAEAEGSPNIKALVAELNEAFAAFKDKHQREVDQVRVQVDALVLDRAAGEMLGNGAAEDDLGGLSTAKAVNAYYKQRAERREESKEANLADTFRVVAGMKPKRATTGEIMASLSEGTDADGGYSVPSQTMPQILGAMAANSSLLSAGAGVVPLDQGAKSVSQAVVDTLPTAAWRQELASITESGPTFRAVTATPKSLACIVRISRELLADSPDIDRSLREVLAQAFALELDRVGLLGTGTDPQPKGLANISGVNAVSLGANGAALADYSPILSGIKAILEDNGPMPTAAIMSPRTLVDFGGLTATDDQPLNKPPLVTPIRFGQTTQIPNDDTAGTNSDASKIYMGDFSRCYFLMREALSLQILREAYAKTGELAFLAHVRADFVVPYPKAFAIVSGVRPAA